MKLYIDTIDLNKIVFAVFNGKKLQKKSYKIQGHESFEILKKLDSFLKANSYKLSAISSIIANKGPGSYTGTRIGVTIANALGLALKIPVKYLDKEKFVTKS
jgi:tRNA A37 threonylcarbamoyladenosine modification protein TsaB